ncbi:MAG TPA: TraB/GumN family protein [Stellaceae bacterium]|jgi:hypothetical protein|nr:TraB/GumN family protein [Stellaceae bacterium]
MAATTASALQQAAHRFSVACAACAQLLPPLFVDPIGEAVAPVFRLAAKIPSPLVMKRPILKRSRGFPLVLRAVVVAIGFCCCLGNASAALAAPSLWVIKSPLATVYLFGTIHLLRASQDWETPTIKGALNRSQELWLEVPDLDTGAARQFVTQFGYDPAHPLSTVLPAKDLVRLKNAASSVGLPQGEATLEPMRPWLAALAVTESQMAHAGFDTNAGVEHILQDQWSTSHKAVRGFETLDRQLHFFADLSPRLQEEVLENALDDFDDGPAKLNAIIAAWLQGDQQTIARLVVDELRQPLPDLYRILIVERNEHWTDTIAGMLKQPGVRFIAVGAGHLAGPDSVQAKLAAKGIEAELVR